MIKKYIQKLKTLIKKYKLAIIIATVIIFFLIILVVVIFFLFQFINTPPYSFDDSQMTTEYLASVNELANLQESELFAGPEIDNVKIYGDLTEQQYLLVTVFEDQELDVTDFNPLTEDGTPSEELNLENACDTYFEKVGDTVAAQFYEAECDGDYYYIYVNKNITEGENIITFASIGLDEGIFNQAITEYTER